MPVKAPPPKTVDIHDFSGGPNLRDAQSELAGNEAVDSWNATYDERGGVSSRLGYAKWNSTAFTDGGGGGLVVNVFYSKILGAVLTQAGDDLYLGTTNTSRQDFTTAGRLCFADFAGKVYAAHPVDGLYHSTDGITWTSLADTDLPDTITAIFPWQNRLFAAVDNRIFWSAVGDGTNWTATDFNALREKDDEDIVALAGGSGVDVAGTQGLLAFKRESFYRIIDSTTGEYVTMDPTVGAASNIATVSHLGRTYFLSQHGIFSTDGVTPGARNESDRFEPLWDPAQLAYGQLNLMCAGRRGSRLSFSLPRAGSTANDLALEFHPEQKWIAPGSNAASCYATFGDDDEALLAGSPSVPGQVYELYSGGTDDGTAISWWFQTRWIEPEGGLQVQVWRVRTNGRTPSGGVTMTVRKNFQTAGGDAKTVDMSGSASTYDSGTLYDDSAVYGPASSQEYANVFGVGRCKSVSFRFSGSTSTTRAGSQLLGQGTAPVVGAFSLYSLQLLYVPTGVA